MVCSYKQRSGHYRQSSSMLYLLLYLWSCWLHYPNCRVGWKWTDNQGEEPHQLLAIILLCYCATFFCFSFFFLALFSDSLYCFFIFIFSTKTRGTILTTQYSRCLMGSLNLSIHKSHGAGLTQHLKNTCCFASSCCCCDCWWTAVAVMVPVLKLYFSCLCCESCRLLLLFLFWVFSLFSIQFLVLTVGALSRARTMLRFFKRPSQHHYVTIVFAYYQYLKLLCCRPAPKDNKQWNKLSCCFYSVNGFSPGYGCQKGLVEELAHELHDRRHWIVIKEVW